MSPRVAVLLFAGMAIFGSGTPVSKIVGEGLPPFLASGLRMVLAAAVLVPLMAATRRSDGRPALPSLDRHNWLLLGGIALFGMFAFSLFMLYGMQLASGVAGSIVMATTPAVTAVASVLFLRDRPTAWTIGAVVLAVAGVAVVNLAGTPGEQGSGSNVLLGSLLVFGAVCGEAAYTLIGKQLTVDMRPIDIAAIASVLAVPLFAPIAAVEATSVDWGAVGVEHWVALGWWGLGTLALGTTLWYLGVMQVSGATASAFMGAMPLSALVLSYLLLGEAFEPIHLLGAAAVFGAIGLVAWGDRHRSA